ncbi:unspecified product [Leishmania tarentolae]|uniref:Unspecified product n=1 Tax=Leishmania tarentolae TaxID=5689 RepID=A0A640KAN4_LEITA|nr:unspecified product [Leishmania tarentolae]GET86766.1 unspecified product [Leishmania tarentolae]
MPQLEVTQGRAGHTGAGYRGGSPSVRTRGWWVSFRSLSGTRLRPSLPTRSQTPPLPPSSAGRWTRPASPRRTTMESPDGRERWWVAGVNVHSY